MSVFKPKLLSDEQMSLFETRNTLLFQIREELKLLNQNLQKVYKPPETKVELKKEKKPTRKGEKA